MAWDFCNLRCAPERISELRERYEGVGPGWHMNKKHWISVRFDSDVPEKKVLELVKQSYELAVAHLTKKQQAVLSEEKSDEIYRNHTGRYASTRFPAKPLALLGGKPVIRRVYEQVAGVLDDAGGRHRRRAYLRCRSGDFGGKAEMTSADHKSGTDRCWEAYLRQGKPYDVVVNVQGDEPFIRASQIEAVNRCFDDPDTDIATLVKPFGRSGRPGRAGKPQFAESGARCAVAGHLFFAFGHPLSARRRTLAVACAPYVLQAPRPLCLPHGGAVCRHGAAAFHARKGRVARAVPLA